MKKTSDTLAQLFKHSVERFGKRKALSFIGKEELTYEQLDELKSKISFWLAGQGVAKGDKVAIIGENSPNWVAVYWGIVTMGATSVPLLPDFATHEIEKILMHSDTKILFISNRIWKRHHEALRFTGKIVILDNLTVFEEEEPITRYALRPEFQEFVPEEVIPDEIANIIYTSGTTGTPKGVMLSHGGLTYECDKVSLVQDINERDVFLSLLPLSHVYENVLGLIYPMRQGASIYYMSKLPTPTVLMDAMAKVRPTMILTVPLIIEKIYHSRIRPHLTRNGILRGAMHIWPIRYFLNNMAGKKLKQAFGGRIRFFGIGGASLNPMTEQFLRDARFPYSCGYGLTETSSLIFASKVGSVKFQSVGKPLNGLDYRIVKASEHKEEGEVLVRWKGNMKGYYKEPGLTASVLTEGNWFHTGDLAMMRNGNLFIRGRSKAMILGPSGENIYPEEIESVLNRMDGVVESLVCQIKGKIVAKVYLNTDELSKKYEFFKQAATAHSADTHTRISQYLTDMQKKLNAHLNRYSQVAKMELVHHPFEKTPTHKIKRHLYH